MVGAAPGVVHESECYAGSTFAQLEIGFSQSRWTLPSAGNERGCRVATKRVVARCEAAAVARVLPDVAVK